MKKQSGLKRLMSGIKILLLLAAVVFLYNSVAWFDYATLDDGTKDGRNVKVVSIDEQAETLTYLDEGESVTVPFSNIKFKDEKTQKQRDIRPGVRTVVQTARWDLVAIGLIMFLPVWFLNAERLRVLLGIQTVTLPFWAAVKLTWIGSFFNFAMPSSVGGDVIKAWYLTEYTHHKTEAITTIFCDRIIGMIGNVLIASIMLAILVMVDGQYISFLLVPALLWVGFFGVAALATSDWLRKLLRLQMLTEMLPFSAQLQRIGATVIKFGQHPWHVGWALLLTLILQFLVYGSLIVMAHALSMEGSLLHYLAFIPIGFMIQAVPISIQGLGLMEAAFIAFFAAPTLANTASQAVTLALAGRLTQLFWALPGAVLPLLGGGHRPTEAELEAFDEEVEEIIEHDNPDPEATPASS